MLITIRKLPWDVEYPRCVIYTYCPSLRTIPCDNAHIRFIKEFLILKVNANADKNKI